MKRRIFIAINLPAEVCNYLTRVIDKLVKLNKRQPIKWVNPAGLHITLHFLGYLDDSQIQRVKKALATITQNYSAAKLTLQRFNAFPNLSRPRVLIIKTREERGRAVSSLQLALGKELEKLEIDVDHRPWQPHITLGRAKGPVNLKIIDKIEPRIFSVNKIDLMESHLSSTGAEYTILESFLLKH